MRRSANSRISFTLRLRERPLSFLLNLFMSLSDQCILQRLQSLHITISTHIHDFLPMICRQRLKNRLLLLHLHLTFQLVNLSRIKNFPRDNIKLGTR